MVAAEGSPSAATEPPARAHRPAGSSRRATVAACNEKPESVAQSGPVIDGPGLVRSDSGLWLLRQRRSRGRIQPRSAMMRNHVLTQATTWPVRAA